MKNRNMVLSALFLALGVILPFLTGQIPQIGAMLLPMHIPVFLCAFVCGAKYGVSVAVILPILRTILFGKPNFYPEAVAIAFEMGTYALISGVLYKNLNFKFLKNVYVSLIISMIVGRAVRGAVQFVLMKFIGAAFTFEMFFAGVVFTSVPGIIIQLIMIPLIMLWIKKL